MGIFSLAGRDADMGVAEHASGRGPAAASAAAAPGHAVAAPGELLREMADILLANLFDAAPDNLVLACRSFSGGERRAAARIGERRDPRMPVTPEQGGVNDAGYGIAGDGKRTLGEAMRRLVDRLTRLVAPGRSAGAPTAGRGPAAERHARADELANQDLESASMAHLTRAMIERTRQAEAGMARSERETRDLRDSLQRARRDAELDYMTGLPNRRAFDALYTREYREAHAQADHLTVAFCDIDNFKVINDTHGHSVGDRVIQAAAEHLKRVAGDNCHVARHGGEEFVLLFRGLTTEDATDRLNDARLAFARRPLADRDADEAIGPVTFSAGVADVFAYGTASLALKAADDALYAAKAGGRNCIRLARG